MMRNILYGLFVTCIIILLSFAYLGYKYFPKNTISLLKNLHLSYLFLSFLGIILYHTFDTLRLLVLARALGIRYSLFYGYLVSFTNTFGATVTPAHLGGEILPLYTLARKGGQFYQIMTIVTMKAISGSFFYILFLPLTIKTLIRDPKQTKEFLAIVGSLILLSLIIYLLYKFLLKKNTQNSSFLYRLKRTFLRYFVTCRSFFKREKMAFIQALLLSLLLYTSFLFIGVFLTKAFNPKANFVEVFLDQLPLLYAIFISPTPGGSGVGELGALPIFSPHLPVEHLGLFVILWRVISQYLSALIGGFIFLIFLWKDLYKMKT